MNCRKETTHSNEQRKSLLTLNVQRRGCVSDSFALCCDGEVAEKRASQADG